MMIIKKDTIFPSKEEVNGIIQQIYEQLIMLLEENAGNFQKGILFFWSDDKIIGRVRMMQERIEKTVRNRTQSGLYTELLAKVGNSYLHSFSLEEKAAAQQFFRSSQVDHLDVIVYKEFQRLKLKAIKILQENYSIILSTVGDDIDAIMNMLKVVGFLGKEKMDIAASINVTTV